MLTNLRTGSLAAVAVPVRAATATASAVMSLFVDGTVCASGHGSRTAPARRIGSANHYRVLAANIPGRMDVQSMRDCSIAKGHRHVERDVRIWDLQPARRG